MSEVGASEQPDVGWDDEDLNIILLDGEPPAGFDCGREAQNAYLYECAWRDFQQDLSKTHLFFIKGIFAGYVTLTMDALPLSSSEKDKGVRYPKLGALKLAQMGVDRRFQGQGFGRFLVGYAIQYARDAGIGVGCRYVTLDAQPDLVEWYQRQGFVRNKLDQKERIARAIQGGRDPAALTISMRYDLRERR